MIARRLILLSLLVLALAAPAAAQVTTEIVADTAAGLTTGTAITNAGAITTIDGGVRAGGNLFHSFTTFNLAQGGTARWTAADPGGVANVVNRVTGGGLSTIAGTLDSTGLPNADFYFINPAGVLFTTGARLNVPGAAHFSTGADGLKFADGAKFSAIEPNGAFSMAAPQSFGFLGGENAIVILGVGADPGAPFIGLNSGLSLTAANVGIQDSFLFPRSIDIVATGDQVRTVLLADPFGGSPLTGLALLINSEFYATATGKGAPSIRIAAGDFAQIGGVLSASTVFSGDAGDVNIRAQTVDITGVVSSGAGENVVKGDAGNVIITAGSLRVGDAAQVSSATFGVGNAGNVTITADTILIESKGSIGSDTLGANTTGRGGRVDINAGTLTLRDDGAISSSTNGLGDAGVVNIVAGSLLLDNGGISSSALAGTGHGGIVTIQADDLELRNGSGISSGSFTAGDAGSIQIKTGSLRVLSQSGISSFGAGAGAAGDISIDAPNLTVDSSIIFSDTFKGGRAGDVTIRATDLTVANSVLSSDTEGSGSAGNLTLTAKRLTVSGNSLITSSTSAAGASGQVSITADQAVFNQSKVFSQANPDSSGRAGDLSITAGKLTATNETVISSTTFGAGAAGQVSVVAQDIVLDDSVIVSRAIEGSQGNAGQVAIRTGTLALTGESSVSSATFAAGDAGGVTITAAKVSVDNSAIESAAGVGSTGRGGTVTITADDLTLQNFGQVATSALGAGDAGQVRIFGGQVSVTGGSLLASRARGAATGAPGSVTVEAQDLTVLTGGQIETSSQNPNTAGDIKISSAGPISIAGLDSHIASENLSSAGGAAGSILIAGAPITLADGGSISTNAVTGPAGDISLFLPSDSLLRLEGRSAPGVITTSSGPGTGGRIVISNPLAVISNGGRILALGQAQGANVQIRSDFFIRAADRLNQLSVDGDLVLDSQVSDVSAGAAIPDVSFLDASGVLRGQCPAVRSSGITSQLSLRAFGPYTADPTSAPPSGEAAARQGGCS